MILRFAKGAQKNGRQFAIRLTLHAAQNLSMTYRFQKVCKSTSWALRFLEKILVN
jgi:hypothetical protein